MENRFVIGLFTLAALLVSACGEGDSPPPPPQELTRHDTGYFCSMTVVGHPGPKAQIHLTGTESPLWFTSVRDMFGFLMLPGESKEIAAIYVTDMSANSDWENTVSGPWIDPKTSWFVIDSAKAGGMGAKETIPFSDENAAKDFVEKYGGRIVSFEDVPEEYIFGSDSGSDLESQDAPTSGES